MCLRLDLFLVLFFFFLLGFPLESTTQILDRFEKPELDKAIWAGDTEDFIIENGQLRLSASANKERSLLVADLNTLTNLDQLNIDIQMKFNPSRQNHLNLWVYSDNPNPDEANGVVMRIGEAGNKDAITFFQKEGEDIFPIAIGRESGVATAPSISLELCVVGDEIIAQIINEAAGNETIVFQRDQIQRQGFFIIDCNYTSTRADKFFFDNFYVGPKVIDITPPMLTSSNITDEIIELLFDERLDINTLSNENFNFSPALPLFEFSAENQKVQITSNEPFARGIEYTLHISNVNDLSGNSLDTTIVLTNLRQPVKGEVLINEILFNPRGNGSDYVELINTSDETLSLADHYIANGDNGQRHLINGVQVIKGGELLLFTENPDNVKSEYPTHDEHQIYEQNLPALNNNNGNVSLIQNSLAGLVEIDSYSYSEKDHFLLLDEEDGVALERISTTQNTANKSNWTSASSLVGFGTPGLKNSVTTPGILPTNNFFKVTNKVFSPDGDNFDDIAEVSYQLPSSFVANATVYDLNGNVVKRIWKNETTNTEGALVWDGTNASNQVSQEGIYVIVIEIFKLDGRVIRHKEELVLAQARN